jgi:hypothetical protein
MKSFYEPPLDWSRPEAEELLDILVNVYKNRRAAEIITGKAGLKSGYVPEISTPRHMWRSSLEVVADQGLLSKLVGEVYEDPEAGGYRNQLEKFLAMTDQAKPGDGLGRTRIRREHKRWPGMDVSIAHEISAIARSVVRINVTFAQERASATGFLIAPDCILTNYYNLFAPEFGSLLSVKAEFDFEQTTPLEQRLVVAGDVETVQGSHENYWAVFQLERPVDRPPIPLGTPYEIAREDPLVIIQHPQGRLKQFATAAEAIQYLDDKWIHYSDMTEPGSAGAPVFNAVMHVVALHNVKRLENAEEYGLGFVEWQGYGVRIERIVDDLAARGIPHLTR